MPRKARIIKIRRRQRTAPAIFSSTLHARTRQQTAPIINASTLDNARNGSLQDLRDLAGAIPTMPVTLLRDALEAFVSSLKSSPTATNLRFARSTPGYSNAIAAMGGLEAFVRSDEFKTKTSYADYLFKAWDGLARVLLDFLTVASDAASRSDTPNGIGWRAAQFTVFLLKSLKSIDKRTLKERLNNKVSRLLIFTIWLREWGKTDLMIAGECGSLLLTCLYDNSSDEAWYHLLETAGDPAPVHKVANLAIKRLKKALNDTVPKGLKDQYRMSCIMAISFLAMQPTRELARALVENGALGPIMRVLTKTTSKSTNDSRMLYTAMECILFLDRAFDVSLRCFIKALRMGFLRALVHFSFSIEQIEAIKPSAVPLIKHALQKMLPQYLTFTKVIRALCNAMRSLSAKEREEIRGSNFKKEWRAMEVLLSERLAIFRIDAIQGRLVRCDACGDKKFKVRLQRCNGCGEALYCSKECQRRAWQELGHEAVCGVSKSESAVSRPIKSRKFVEDIVSRLVMQDTQRLFYGAVKQRFGCLEQFDRTKYIMSFDYRSFPPTCEFLEIAAFLSLSQPAEPLKTQLTKFQGQDVLFDSSGVPPTVRSEAIFYDHLLRSHTLSRVVPLNAYYASAPGRYTRTWPRTMVQLRDKPDESVTVPLNEPNTDEVDLVLRKCESSIDTFWDFDFDDIVTGHHKQVEARTQHSDSMVARS